MGCLPFRLSFPCWSLFALLFFWVLRVLLFFFPLDFVSVTHLCCSLGCPAVLPLVLSSYPPSSLSQAITILAILVWRLVASYSNFLLFIIFLLAAVLPRLPCGCSLSLSLSPLLCFRCSCFISSGCILFVVSTWRFSSHPLLLRPLFSWPWFAYIASVALAGRSLLIAYLPSPLVRGAVPFATFLLLLFSFPCAFL